MNDTNDILIDDDLQTRETYKLDLLLSENFTIKENEIIAKAYDFAINAHSGVKRSSGEPYFSHVYEVAKILKDANMDPVSIVSGLLHDTVEDVKGITTETIKTNFGPVVAQIVHGVTKIRGINYLSKTEKFKENLRKIIFTAGRDIRVLIVKVADRLHNMRTLGHVKEEKQKRISIETSEIYAPIASRLGMYKIKTELEDLSLKYIDPYMYRYIANQVRMELSKRKKIVEELTNQLEQKIKEKNIHDIEVFGRPKHFYSIYRKMQSGYEFDQIHDLIGLRVITEEKDTCYIILGIVHGIWSTIPERFKDYISNPKENGYQSLHTTVVTNTGSVVEIQIRTKVMHDIAEEGIAAHWKYKNRIEGDDEQTKYIEDNLNWVSSIKNWSQGMKNQSGEFVEDLKYNMLGDKIRCYTPLGKTLKLPKGSTPIDFAYHIHSEVGNRCVGARVTRDHATEILSLYSELQHLDVVHIITSEREHPEKDWLKIVKTASARNGIKHWLKSHEYRENYEKGKEIFENALKMFSIPIDSEEKDYIVKSFLKERKTQRDEETMYFEIGFSGITQDSFTNRIKQYADITKTKKYMDRKTKSKGKSKKSNIITEGIDDKPILIAKCCSPVPGDNIAGFLTNADVIKVHKPNCYKYNNMIKEAEAKNETHRNVKCRWKDEKVVPPIRVNLIAKNNDYTILSIGTIIQRNKTAIINVNTRKASNYKNEILLVLRCEKNDDEFKEKLIKDLEASEYVIKATLQE